MSDVEAGKISTILCKDMSRLGRDHVQVGMYMELFRKKSVRFIAVTNNIDSASPETLEFAPFVNLLNEFYAKDISRKIMAAKRSNGRNGKYVASIAPYGYQKCETDKSKWEIDPVAAEVVKRIFQLTIEGYGIGQIATILTKDRVHSPSYYLAQKGTGPGKNKAFDDPYHWQSATVDIIITRLEYKGCMVNLKTQKQSFKDKQSKPVPREQWLVFENKHEAIIDETTWQTANDIRQKKRRNKPNSLGQPHPLTGLLYCETCKAKMHHNRGTLTGTNYVKNYYTCKNSKNINATCTSHSIKGNVVEELILDTLKSVIKYASTCEKAFTQEIHNLFSAQQASTVKSQRKKLTTSQSRYAELDKLIQRIYEDNVAGKINDKRFEVLSSQYEQEQVELEQVITQLTTELDSFADSSDKASKFLELTKRYRDFDELTPTMLHEFVDRVEIHEKADKGCKVTTQNVDIYLNFIGFYVPPMSEADQTQALDPEAQAAHDKRMEKLLYQREYKKRREANGGKPLGQFNGNKKPDHRTPEEKATYEAEKAQRQKAYHAKWYQDNKERMKAEQVAKLAQMTPEERAERSRKRTESRRAYEVEYREKNRDKMNAYARDWNQKRREKIKVATSDTVPAT